MLEAQLTCSRTCINSCTMLFSAVVLITTFLMDSVETKSVAFTMDQEGLNETFSKNSDEMLNFKRTNADPLINNRDWTMVDFLLCLAVLFVFIVCVVFCYFLGVFEACKRRSERTGDDQYDRRTIRGKGFAGCADCID